MAKDGGKAKAVNSATYKARVAAGFCAANASCEWPPEPGSVRCDYHLNQKNKWYKANQAEPRKAEYLQRKVDGKCVRNKCPNDAAADSLMCDRHRKRQRELEAARAKTEVFKVVKRRCDKRRKRGRRREGLCERCHRKRVTARWCEKHRKEHNSYSYTPKPNSKRKCRRCLELGLGPVYGHDTRTCTSQEPHIDLKPLPPLRIDDFMTGGVGWF